MKLNSRARNILTNMGLVVVSLAICFLGLEIWARVTNKEPLFSWVNFAERNINFFTTNVIVSHSPTLGWISMPHIQKGSLPCVTSGGWTTGDLGVRMNSDKIIPLPQSCILASGDSFGVGAEVQDHETYPAQLEKMMQQPVVNAGAGGWAVDQIILRVEELIPIVKPHTIIIGILTADIFRNCYEVYGSGYKPYFIVKDGKLELKGVPVPKVEKQKLVTNPFKSTLGYSYFLYWFTKRVGKEKWLLSRKDQYHRVMSDEAGVETCVLLMDRLKELQEKEGVRIVILMQYGPDEILKSDHPHWKVVDNRPWYVAPVLKRARENGLIVVDAFDAVKAVSNQSMNEFYKLWMMKDNNKFYGHMSPEGNKLMAQLIFDVLKNP